MTMTRVKYKRRLFFDYDFVNDSIQNSSDVFWKLMHINVGSLEHKKKHNIISKKVLERIFQNNPKIRKEWIKCGVSWVDEPEEIESIADEIERNIEYSNYYATETPFKVYLMTTGDQKQHYLENPHFEGVLDVQIISGSDAQRIIEKYFRAKMENSNEC